MLATIINAAAILLGGTVGLLFGKRIPQAVSNRVLTAMGFVVVVIGVQCVFSIQNILVTVVSVAVGTALGTLLKLDERINRLGDTVKSRLSGTALGRGAFSEGLVAATLLFCSGTMAILGSIHAGLDHDYSILLTKSVMDGIASIAFASAFGSGVLFSAIPILVYQGAITLLAGTLEPVLTSAVIGEMSGVGGPIFLAMACNMLGLGKERFAVGDMLPCVFLPILLVPLMQALGLY